MTVSLHIFDSFIFAEVHIGTKARLSCIRCFLPASLQIPLNYSGWNLNINIIELQYYFVNNKFLKALNYVLKQILSGQKQ